MITQSNCSFFMKIRARGANRRSYPKRKVCRHIRLLRRALQWSNVITKLWTASRTRFAHGFSTSRNSGSNGNNTVPCFVLLVVNIKPVFLNRESAFHWWYYISHTECLMLPIEANNRIVITFPSSTAKTPVSMERKTSFRKGRITRFDWDTARVHYSKSVNTFFVCGLYECQKNVDISKIQNRTFNASLPPLARYNETLNYARWH